MTKIRGIFRRKTSNSGNFPVLARECVRARRGRTVRAAVAAAFVAAVWIPGAIRAETENGGAVHFEDEVLEDRVRLVLGLDEEATITPELMLELEFFECRDATDLTGLEYAENLEHLRLFNGSTGDLGPISGLTELRALTLNLQGVGDLDALAGLASLERLELYGNAITDPGPLSELTGLHTLILGDNRIENVEALAELTNLEALDLWRNRITDAGPLSGLHGLKKLDLMDNLLDDVGSPGDFTHLEELNLEGNFLDFSPGTPAEEVVKDLVREDVRVFFGRQESIGVHHVSDGVYAPGETVNIEVVLDFDRDFSGLAFRAEVPVGWSYVSGEGEPDVTPEPGETGMLEWAWSGEEENGAIEGFMYTLVVPPAASGAYSVAGTLTWEWDDYFRETPARPGPLVWVGEGDVVMDVVPGRDRFAVKGGEGGLDVTANTAWRVEASPEWLTVTSGPSGGPEGTVVYRVADATWGSWFESRSGSLVVSAGDAEEVFEVTQTGHVPLIGSVPQGAVFSAQGGEGEFAITVPLHMSHSEWWLRFWYEEGERNHARLESSWVEIVPEWRSGYGDATIPYSVLPNQSSHLRHENIDVQIGSASTLAFQVVQQSRETYEGWSERHFGEEADEALTDPEASPAGDAVPNLVKYALGLDPNEPAQAVVPDPEIADGHMTLTYMRDPNVAEVSVVAEWSDNLVDWYSGAEFIEIVDREDDGFVEEITIRAVETVEAGDRQFFRLQVGSDASGD